MSNSLIYQAVIPIGCEHTIGSISTDVGIDLSDEDDALRIEVDDGHAYVDLDVQQLGFEGPGVVKEIGDADQVQILIEDLPEGTKWIRIIREGSW